MARSAVGSVADRKVSNALAVLPSKAKVPAEPISSSPVIVPPASASFSLFTSSIAACTLFAAIVPSGVNATCDALTLVNVWLTSTSVHSMPVDSTMSGGAKATFGALPLVMVPPSLTTR